MAGLCSVLETMRQSLDSDSESDNEEADIDGVSSTNSRGHSWHGSLQHLPTTPSTSESEAGNASSEGYLCDQCGRARRKDRSRASGRPPLPSGRKRGSRPKKRAHFATDTDNSSDPEKLSDSLETPLFKPIAAQNTLSPNFMSTPLCSLSPREVVKPLAFNSEAARATSATSSNTNNPSATATSPSGAPLISGFSHAHSPSSTSDPGRGRQPFKADHELFKQNPGALPSSYVRHFSRASSSSITSPTSPPLPPPPLPPRPPPPPTSMTATNLTIPASSSSKISRLPSSPSPSTPQSPSPSSLSLSTLFPGSSTSSSTVTTPDNQQSATECARFSFHRRNHSVSAVEGRGSEQEVAHHRHDDERFKNHDRHVSHPGNFVRSASASRSLTSGDRRHFSRHGNPSPLKARKDQQCQLPSGEREPSGNPGERGSRTDGRLRNVTNKNNNSNNDSINRGLPDYEEAIQRVSLLRWASLQKISSKSSSSPGGREGERGEEEEEEEEELEEEEEEEESSVKSRTSGKEAQNLAGGFVRRSIRHFEQSAISSSSGSGSSVNNETLNSCSSLSKSSSRWSATTENNNVHNVHNKSNSKAPGNDPLFTQIPQRNGTARGVHVAVKSDDIAVGGGGGRDSSFLSRREDSHESDDVFYSEEWSSDNLLLNVSDSPRSRGADENSEGRGRERCCLPNRLRSEKDGGKASRVSYSGDRKSNVGHNNGRKRIILEVLV